MSSNRPPRGVRSDHFFQPHEKSLPRRKMVPSITSRPAGESRRTSTIIDMTGNDDEDDIEADSAVPSRRSSDFVDLTLDDDDDELVPSKKRKHSESFLVPPSQSVPRRDLKGTQVEAISSTPKITVGSCSVHLEPLAHQSRPPTARNNAPAATHTAIETSPNVVLAPGNWTKFPVNREPIPRSYDSEDEEIEELIPSQRVRPKTNFMVEVMPSGVSVVSPNSTKVINQKISKSRKSPVNITRFKRVSPHRTPSPHKASASPSTSPENTSQPTVGPSNLPVLEKAPTPFDPKEPVHTEKPVHHNIGFSSPARHRSQSLGDGSSVIEEELDLPTPLLRAPSPILGESQESFPSIGASSPILTRKQQRQQRSDFTKTKDANEVTELSQVHLENSLTRFSQQMKADHSLTVRWLLYDAAEASKHTPKLFIDQVSPFAAMKRLDVRASDGTSSECVTETIDSHYYTKGKQTKSKKISTKVAIKAIRDTTPSIPKYFSVTYAKRNHLTVDDDFLRFVPYFANGNDHSNDLGKISSLEKEIGKAYKNKDRTQPCVAAESAIQVRCYLDSWLEELPVGFDERCLQRYLLLSKRTNISFKKNKRLVNKLVDSLGGPLNAATESRVHDFVELYEEIFPQKLIDVVFPESHLREMIKSSLRSNPGCPPAQISRLSSFADLTCIICGVISCQTHGDYRKTPIYDASESDASDQEIPVEHEHVGITLEQDDSRRRYDSRALIRAQRQEDDLPIISGFCSDSCYNHNRSEEQYEPWSDEKLDILNDILVKVTNESYQACTISFAMSWPCWQVYQEIKNHDRNDISSTLLRTDRSTKVSNRPYWYNNARKTLVNSWQDETNAHLHQHREQWSPCFHEGPCVQQCPCVKQNLLCEIMCACPDNCGRRFTGCSCASNGISCISDSCLCIQMNRECGPQCSTCGAVERLDPSNKHNDNLFLTGCQNVVLQRGVYKKIMTGTSQLEGVGFGAYILEPTRKGDIVSEYLGEIISGGEADRRGITYDRAQLSFLFEINGEFVIDAARVGNKTRFINHANDDSEGLNCKAEILLVNGEHRIKLFALRDIKVGEELLFNYGEKFAKKHGLDKKLPKMKASISSGGVMVGKDALDVLDGIDSEARASRHELQAKRTSLSQAGADNLGKGRARKSAPRKEKDVVDPVKESVLETDFVPPVEADDEDDGDFEDDDDASPVRPRSTRRVRAPVRYTW